MNKDAISREELYKEVWQTPMSKLALKYNMSDSGLRKKCINYNIPLPPMGYWSKIKFGKKVKIPSLPEIENNDNIVLLYRDDEVDVTDPKIPFATRQNYVKSVIESNSSLPIAFPEKIINPDKLTIATKEYLNSRKKDDRLWYSNNGPDVLDIHVSYENRKRAILLMDYFVKLIRALGHDIKIEYGRTKVLMYGTDKEISLRERYIYSDADDHSSKKKETLVHLVFRAGSSYHYRWEDSKSKHLENKIISIIAYLEVKARELRACWDHNAKLKQEREERERIRKEMEERKNNEIRKFNEVLDEAERWHKSRSLRDYINHLESHSIINHEDQHKWLQWAKDKADWYDPLKNRSDEILGDYSKTK